MNNCCVCLENTKNINFIKCNTCKNTIVCVNCFDVMKSNNINDKCPVCRTTDWNYVDSTVIIIYETQNPVLENIEVNQEQTNNTCISTYLCNNLYSSFSASISYLKEMVNYTLQKIKPPFIIFVKIVVCCITIWCCGFICICIFLWIFCNNVDYVNYIKYPYVFIITYIIGLFLLTSCYCCKTRISSNDNS